MILLQPEANDYIDCLGLFQQNEGLRLIFFNWPGLIFRDTNKKIHELKRMFPSEKAADNQKLCFITSVRSKAAFLICRQDRCV